MEITASRHPSPLSLLLAKAAYQGVQEQAAHGSSNEDLLTKAVNEAAQDAQQALNEIHEEHLQVNAPPEDQEAELEKEAIAQAIEPLAAEDPFSSQRVAVWVTGFPRSGSSTTLSLVKALSGNTDSMAAGKVFSLFEPCHEGDELEPWLRAEGCSGLLTHVSKCDFGGVTRLWGWNQPHTTNNHTMEFSKDAAGNYCEGSNVIAFKTVDYGHDLSQFIWLLDSTPSMRIVATVRDPRGIYASWKTTKPFRGLLKRRWLCGTCPGGLFYNLTQICDAYAANLDVADNRIHTVVFEELLRQPANVTKRVYDFLGMDFGEPQMDWINRTFDAADCPEEPSWHQGFADCHTKSASQVESWRTVLDAKEIEIFNTNENCRRVAEAYGYPPN